MYKSKRQKLYLARIETYSVPFRILRAVHPPLSIRSYSVLFKCATV